MDQRKIGGFLKELRKEKEMTQEKLAEHFGVSARTVSRWETGSNMPDLDILIELADYYEVEIKEILDGERKSEKMNREVEVTARKMAEYSNEEKKRLGKRMSAVFLIGMMAFTLHLILSVAELDGLFAANGVLSGFSLGMAYGIMIMGYLYATGRMARLRSWKMKLLKRKEN